MVKINHFIRVKGQPNSGKTTTITWSFLKLLTEKRSNLKCLRYLEYGDFVAVIERNGKMIGFVSGGEAIDDGYEALCEMFEGEIEVCVFATRTHGGSKTTLEKILRENDKQEADVIFNSGWIDMMKETQEQMVEVKEEVANELQKRSDELLERIKEYL
ncbi:hypothetical protein [Helicobacter sp. MIT 05-5294]|uniref:hypothetical protein n=1 Tax=Helicobacter sp. MIT 05-5294 TaxID=1548150 RepID=UPI0010FEFAAF|nr:hypothetical protein [Helicobacter sp. MIT 05-5294]TLD88576.1 hypothetical protein LS69_001420 [Helicobacter sp. MIT 05-5294]